MGKGHGDKSRLAEALIAALLTQPTVAEAAAKAGLSYVTVKRWLVNPAFLARYRAARLAIVDQATNQLLDLCGQATATLKKNLSGESGAVANRAAELVFQFVAKGLELRDLAAELAEVKAQLQEIRHARHDEKPAVPAEAGPGTTPATADQSGLGSDSSGSVEHPEIGGPGTGQLADGGSERLF